MKLIALYPILFRSRQYEIGEELPADDASMVEAWVEAKSAAWQEEQPTKTKAKSVTAQAGLPGSAAGSETDDNLVGIVPKTPARKR